MFKRLFTINYNNKKFVIFTDENHRKTFLEEKNNRLIYPDLKDFIYLNEIYNYIDYTILYNVKKYNFIEKVIYNKKLISLALATELGLFSYFTTDNIRLIKNINSSNPSTLEETVINNNEEIDYQKAFQQLNVLHNNEVVTKEDVMNAIENNPNLNDRLKFIAKMVLASLLENDPNINLRIYYENIKNIFIELMPIDSLQILKGKIIDGCFDAVNDQIIANILAQDVVLAHELAHAAHNYYTNVEGEEIIIHETLGRFLEEAMTNKLIKHSFGTSDTYTKEGLLLDFFMYNAPEFTIHNYNEQGITALISILKQKYPNVDIDYILDFAQSYNTTYVKFGYDNAPDFYDKCFLDELFQITISNINKSNIIDSFNAFIALCDNKESLIEEYYPLYIDAVITYLKNNNINLSINPNNIVFVNGNIYLQNDSETYLDYNGAIKPINDLSITIPITNSFKLELISLIINNATWNNPNTLKELFINNLTDEYTYNLIISLSLGNDNDFIIKSLKDKDGFFTSFKQIMNLTTNPLTKKELYQRYLTILLNNKLINEEQLTIINNIEYLTIYHNEIHYALNNHTYLDYNNQEVSIGEELLLIPIDEDFKEDALATIINNKSINNIEFLKDMLLSNILYDENINIFIQALSLDNRVLLADTIFNSLLDEAKEDIDRIKERFLIIFEPNLDANNLLRFELYFEQIISLKNNFITKEQIDSVASIQKLVIIDNYVYISYDENTYLDYDYNIRPIENGIILPINYNLKTKLLKQMQYVLDVVNNPELLNSFILCYINKDLPSLLKSNSFVDNQSIINTLVGALLTKTSGPNELRLQKARLDNFIHFSQLDNEIISYYDSITRFIIIKNIESNISPKTI